MTRIICDTFVKNNKQIWGNDPNSEFNRKILAVNAMYKWLYEKGYLEKVSFMYKDYSEVTHFALNARDLEPYRKEMEASDVKDTALAVRHIFDEPYSPCVYSGAIELGWTMNSYRSVDGMVGRSWECGLVKSLNTEGIYKVSRVRDEQGVKAAVEELFSQVDWKLTIAEENRYHEAVKYFSRGVQTNIENDYVKEHSRELLYCYDNKKSLIDFDFWTRYETLCDEKMTYEEYLALDRHYDGDPHDLDEDDLDVFIAFKDALKQYREGEALSEIQITEANLFTCYADKGFKFLIKAVDEQDAEKAGEAWYTSIFAEPGHFSCWQTRKEDFHGLDTDQVIESHAWQARTAGSKRPLNSIIQSAEMQTDVAKGRDVDISPER